MASHSGQDDILLETLDRRGHATDTRRRHALMLSMCVAFEVLAIFAVTLALVALTAYTLTVVEAWTILVALIALVLAFTVLSGALLLYPPTVLVEDMNSAHLSSAEFGMHYRLGLLDASKEVDRILSRSLRWGMVLQGLALGALAVASSLFLLDATG